VFSGADIKKSIAMFSLIYDLCRSQPITNSRSIDGSNTAWVVIGIGERQNGFLDPRA
jgi:hypothetical protein